jgi:hypothetical protein
MREVERSRRGDGVEKTVGVELQIENETRRARREMEARKGKGSLGRADLPALTLKEYDGCCFQIETSSALVRRQRLLSLLSSLPHSLSSLLPPSLLCPFLSFLFRARLRSPQTTVLMGCMLLSSLSLHGIDPGAKTVIPAKVGRGCLV